MKRSGILHVILSILLFLLLSSPLMAYDAIETASTGTIVGTVKFQEKAPERKEIAVTRNKKVCGKEAKFTESLVVSATGGVKNAVLYLTDIKRGKKFKVPSVFNIDQRGCQFHPHVLIVPAGKSFTLINSDGILHNFRTNSTKNPILNKAQPKFKKKLKVKINIPEIIRANCDVHEWMNMWLVVAEHPYYAITDEGGSFKITDVPPGTYTVRLWHETLGQQTRKVTVKAGEQTKAAFELKKK
ncbi:MAG: carboxypeptidase regulatory-like domain-containing protein [Deltaproteobacteria bacterium]|nr:carboxypeptidase regulatory-like domain-containing protein [Deltaproteobacteria bacterium]